MNVKTYGAETTDFSTVPKERIATCVSLAGVAPDANDEHVMIASVNSAIAELTLESVPFTTPKVRLLHLDFTIGWRFAKILRVAYNITVVNQRLWDASIQPLPNGTKPQH